MKTRNSIIFVLLLALSATVTGCYEKETDISSYEDITSDALQGSISYTGEIVGYLKCPGYVDGNGFASEDITLGLYIISNTKDSLLATHIPHSTIENLLNINVNTLDWGDPVRLTTNIPVVFTYRKAKDNEIIVPSCAHTTLLPPDVLSESIQIIILNIKKNEIH